MADYPAELISQRYLFDGTPVTIRPIRADDKPMEQEFVQHLSADSRYKRFMSTLKELPPGKLKYLTEIDYVRHLALVAIIRREAQDVEIGVARYVAGPQGDDCEFAIAIDDKWQGSGVAGMRISCLRIGFSGVHAGMAAVIHVHRGHAGRGTQQAGTQQQGRGADHGRLRAWYRVSRLYSNRPVKVLAGPLAARASEYRVPPICAPLSSAICLSRRASWMLSMNTALTLA